VSQHEDGLDGLPEKLYYSIREVSDFTGVKAHVLRYWEQEFPTLRPRKNRAGNRSYRRRDIQEIVTIRKLLYEDGFKIDGARKLLKQDPEKFEQLDLLDAADPRRRQKKVAELRRDVADLLEFVRSL
jgi:DNA-binding transcriptional MerR regulator